MLTTLMGKKTVDSVLAVFMKAQTDLQALAAEHTDAAKAKRAQAATITAEADANDAEAARATRVADRAAALLA